MDFEFTREQEEFRAQLRAFLDERMTDEWRGNFGSNAEDMIPWTRRICEDLAERGWLTLSWPKEYGGAEGDLWSQMVLREEMWGNGEPRGPQYMNLNYIGPMIQRFGNDAQKQKHLPRMAAGSVIWTQGFSEPGAGSDLAGLRTRAVDMGDHFVVNGSKIWNSYAGSPADWCILLVRTNPDVPKHQGISVLLVDMTTPGVQVRPIESMAGYGEINEIFFTDAKIPKENLLGEQDGGWPMIVFGLSFERTGIALHARTERTIQRLIDYAKNTIVDGRPLSERPDVRAKIADLYVRFRGSRLLSYRITSMAEAGKDPGPEASMAWAHGGLTSQLSGMVGMEIAAAAGLLEERDPDAALHGQIEREWVEMIPYTIGAGTVDIQKLIIAQRGLGLPKAG
jgi:alkylation response protein AidB-like acyl-CoA dehydrogenase